ncbi:hypothetical protein FQN57_003330 [Myotisia sp. PD_48]|nr:hypothetical protein FQN57_003330 [Myotisia sp. PD_48]
MFLATGLLLGSLATATAVGTTRLADRGAEPTLPYDPNTAANCIWWWDNDGSITCTQRVETWGVKLEDFYKWNPILKGSCDNAKSGNSYCLEAIGGEPTTTTSSPTPSQSPWPAPRQDGTIESCVRFYQAANGDTCGKIVDSFGGTFTLEQFITWNPALGADCSGLWAGYYYCVGIPGTPTKLPTTTATATATTTTPAGPSPTQTGIIKTCNHYHKAVEGDSCVAIVDQYKTFTLDDFLKWNTAVGADCGGLWLGYFYCIGVPGTPTKPPTTTAAPTTTTPTDPSPTQTGIIKNCNRYHKAVSGDSCSSIVDQYGTFNLETFIKWNPAVNTDCSALWLGYYYCIGIPGTPTVKPTPTPTGCTSPGLPSPTQPGAICKCKKWHKVVSGDICESIQNKYRISAADFNKWNPQVGADCKTLWVGYNVCVGA